MSEQMEFLGIDAFKICSVHLITKYKSNCVYKTKFLGYALKKDIELKPNMPNIKHISLSSLSTTFYNHDKFKIKIMTVNEIKNIVDKYYV